MEQPDVNNKPDKTEYELILQAMDDLDESMITYVDEFQSTDNPDKPFIFEYSHEMLTKQNSRYKRRYSEG